MVAEYLYMNIKSMLVPLLLLWVQANLSAGVSISKRSIDDDTRLLIKKEHDETFSTTDELKGFEIFKQEFDKAAQKTIYSSLENPNFKFIHASDDISSGENLIILDPLEDMIVRKNMMVIFLVLRKRISDPNTFTSHLAYIRPINGRISIEWDYFISDESRRKWSFVNAFTSSGFNLVDANRKTREIMAAPGLVAKKARVKSSSSEETAKKKKKKAKKPAADEEEDDDKDDAKDEPVPADCNEPKKGRRKRKAPKVVYKININHIICANGGECKPDPCLGKGKKGDKGRALNVVQKPRTGEELFEGLGKCEKAEPPRETSSPTGRILTGEAQMIEFILQTLKIQCVPDALPQIHNLFKQNLISSSSNFQLELNRQHPLFKVSAPGETEWIDISSALFFKMYSNTYFEEAARMSENEYHALSPKREHISSSIEITTILVLKTIPYFTKCVHVYKIINILENMLQARYSENLRLRPTLQTEQQKAINLNDCMQILCLNKLINVPIIEKIVAENVDKFDLDNMQSTVKLIEEIFNKMYIESFDELKASALNAA